MGRKTKTGLDSFKISVNLLDDDRVLVLTSKYGCKAESILIRLYSMIYKNGYYLELTDVVIAQIAKSINSTHDEVKSVITELTEHKFFDMDLANDDILTSSEIQLQYFGSIISNKRILKKTDSYKYILEEVSEIISSSVNNHFLRRKSEFTQEEISISAGGNNLLRSKCTFPQEEMRISAGGNSDLLRRKKESLSLSLSQINNINNLESKDNIKEENKEESFGVISVHSIDGLKTIMVASPIWKNDIRMYISRLTGRVLSDQQIDDYIDTFSMKLKSEGEKETTEDDAKRHFSNWLRIELTKPSKSKPRFGREKVEDKVFEQF